MRTFHFYTSVFAKSRRIITNTKIAIGELRRDINNRTIDITSISIRDDAPQGRQQIMSGGSTHARLEMELREIDKYS